MPRKPKHVKKTKRKTKAKKRSKPTTFSSHLKASIHQPIPQRYIADFGCGFYGTLAVGQPATNFYDVLACVPTSLTTTGGFITPFNTAVAGQSFTAMGGVLVPATTTLANLYYTGIGPLSLIYTRGRNMRSRLDVTITPTVGADITQVVIFPYSVSSAGAGLPALTELAMMQPYAKAIVVTGSNNIKQNRISCSVNPRKFLGLTKAQYEAENWGAINFRVIYQTFSNAVTTGLMTFENRFTSRIELSQQITEIDVI